jgi:hypothetical protein
VPNTDNNAKYLRERAANFRRLAEDHGNAGNQHIADKLNEVADDFEGQAAELVIAAAFTDLQRRALDEQSRAI